MTNYTTTPLKEDNPPKIAIWDIKRQDYYFLDDFFNLEIDAVGSVILKGKVKSILKNNKSVLEIKAEKIKNILNELKDLI